MSFLGILGKIAAPILAIIDKSVPDKDLAQTLKAEVHMALLREGAAELEASKSIIVAEAQSESWIARNWRPITMLTFTSLVVAKWLGFTAPGVTEEIELALLSIIQVGLGGYVIGRSAEKVAKVWKENGN